MKKILIALLAVVAVSTFAADVLITGFNAETGVGTFKVVSDGTDCTLTVDKLVVSDAVTAPNGVSGASAGVATNIAVTYVTNIWSVLDASTNTVALTNITPAYTVQTAVFRFAGGICTNKP